MLTLLTKLLGIGTGKAVSGIVSEIKQARLNELNAKNNKDRVEAEVYMKQLEAQLQILIAEQRNVLTSWIRPMIAAPFVVYLWKVLVWDMTLGLGTTPQLGDVLGTIMGVVIGAFFLTRALEKKI